MLCTHGTITFNKYLPRYVHTIRTFEANNLVHTSDPTGEQLLVLLATCGALSP